MSRNLLSIPCLVMLMSCTSPVYISEPKDGAMIPKADPVNVRIMLSVPEIEHDFLGQIDDAVEIRIDDTLVDMVQNEGPLVTFTRAAGALPLGTHRLSVMVDRAGLFGPTGDSSVFTIYDPAAVRCGDGTVTLGLEACDDGNVLSGDGCSAACKVESCGDGIKNGSNEACDDANTQNNDGCDMSCQLEVCSNGKLQTWIGEECDDGNRTDGDGCDASCTKEAKCGDGTVQAGEQCEDGNTAAGDGCDAACKIEACGNGILQANSLAGAEECDDGNSADGDGCDHTCTREAKCGNGTLEKGEQCEDGNTTTGDGCDAACKTETCGNGILQADSLAGAEECDDGNTVDDDECTNACATPVCGDSIVTTSAGETCDEGSALPTSTCDAACQTIPQ